MTGGGRRIEQVKITAVGVGCEKTGLPAGVVGVRQAIEKTDALIIGAECDVIDPVLALVCEVVAACLRDLRDGKNQPVFARLQVQQVNAVVVRPIHAQR